MFNFSFNFWEKKKGVKAGIRATEYKKWTEKQKGSFFQIQNEAEELGVQSQKEGAWGLESAP